MPPESSASASPSPSRRVYVRAKRTLVKVRKALNRRLGPHRLRNAIRINPHPKIVIGSGAKHIGGDWVETDREFLDLLRPSDWERFFGPNTIALLLAEHVWEHLTPDEGLEAAKTCYRYLRPGGHLRVAVPDGLHPNPEYREWVRVGGRSPMQVANDHKVLYTYRTIQELLEKAGFQVVLYEYFTESGEFVCKHWDPAFGYVQRSRRFDKRNRDGSLTFTSIVLDAKKSFASPQLQHTLAQLPNLGSGPSVSRLAGN